MINKVILEGRITKDPILRKTQTGASVVSFTIAVNRRIKQEAQPDADFINCVAWNKTADLMAQYVKKGSLISVEGRLQTHNYDDKDGKRIYVTEVMTESIHFLESKNTNAYSPPAGTASSSTTATTPASNRAEFSNIDTIDIASDDLPF